MLVASALFCGMSIQAHDADTVACKPEWGAELTTEFQVSHKGRCNFANLLHLQANIPLSSAVSIDVASITTYMTSKESIGEDLQVFSNIDAENTLFALSVCGVNWQVNDRHSLFLGIRNMNEDYFCSPVTSFFTNSTCGIYPTISCNYDIANYPVSSLGLHYRYTSRPLMDGQGGALVLQASLYNGTAYNRFTGRENIYRFCPKSDGVFAVTEAQYEYKGSQYFLGNTLYYKDKELSASPWFYAEQRLTDRLTLLAGISHAFDADTDCRNFAGVGAHYQLRNTELGIFTDYADFVEEKEWATELTCKFPVTQNISIQPITHFIVTDGHFNFAANLRLTVEL